MTGLSILDATPAHEDVWRALWRGYLDFYGVDFVPETVAFTWSRLMDPASPLKARLALLDGRVAGFAIYQHHPSTWVMGEDCYLEDLFVAAEARGHGIGRALIEDLRTLAAARGWRRLYWLADQDNGRARALYDSFGPSDGHVRYRIDV